MQKPISISVDTTNDATVAKYDNVRKGETLLMTIKLFQNSASLNLTGQTVYIILRKPDGYSVEKSVSGLTGNILTIAFDEQATLAVGEVIGEVQIIDSSGTNITNWFTFEVKPTLADDIIIESSSEIETLQQIQELIDNYNDNADNLATQNNLALQRINTLESDISTGNTLHNNLQNDISIGNALHTTLQNDISTGNSLDTTLKADFVTGETLHNNLTTDIAVANEAIINLAGVNWSTIQSYIDLMDIMLSGMTITDENNVDITDENGNVITM